MLRQTFYYLDIRKNPWKSEDALRCLQLSKLKRLVKHAYGTSSFYKALYDDCQVSPQTIKSLDELGRLPIIDKAMVNCAGHDIISDKYSVTSLLKERTTGTTGVATILYRSEASMDLARAAKYRIDVMNGFRPWMKTANWAFRLQKIRKFSNILGLNRQEMISADIPLKEQMTILQKQRCEVFYCYPSHLVRIARYILDNGIQGIHPKLIVFHSEGAQPPVRKIIEDCFGVNPINIYGAREFGTVAWGGGDAKCQGLHINADLLLLEIIDPDTGQRVDEGEIGHIVITDFTNLARPLIRYDTGDIAVATYNQCGCGMSFPIIKEILGRSVEAVKLPAGGEFTVNMAFPRIMMDVAVIEQYQVIITVQNNLVIKIKTTDDVKINELGLMATISEYCGGIQSEIQYVTSTDEFVRAPSGKFLDFIREAGEVNQ